MDLSKLCRCCGKRKIETNICFKPNGTLYRVPLCARCFQIYRIDADFLQTVMECGPVADYRQFREIQEEIEAVTA